MFDNLNSEQKALLYRALNSELNAIDKLIKLAQKSKDENNRREIDFRHQYEIVHDMIEHIENW